MSIKLMSAIFYHKFPRAVVTVTRKGQPVQKSVFPHSQKLVALALADHANDDGEGAYPSLTTLELKTGMTRPTVSVTLRALKEQGYIKRIGLSKRDTTNYTLDSARFMAETSLQRKPGVVYSVNQGSLQRKPAGSLQRKPEPSFKPYNKHPQQPPDAAADALRLYEQNIGNATPIILEDITKAVTEYGPEWVGDAIREMTIARAKSWRYAESCLANWRANGKQNNRQADAPSAVKRDPMAPFYRYMQEKEKAAHASAD